MLSHVIALSLVIGVAAFAPTTNLPPGIATGFENYRLKQRDVTIALYPPEEDENIVKQNVDNLLKVELLHGKAIDSDIIAEKQRLLNAEIAKVHDLVRYSRSSFLRDYPESDYQLNVHPPESNSAEIDAALKALLKVENVKSAVENADYQADKKALLLAELRAARAIGAGNA